MEKESYESVLNDLESYHSGAYLMNDVEMQFRLERAMIALQANTGKEIFSKEFKECMFTNFSATVKKTLREFPNGLKKDSERKNPTLRLKRKPA